MSISQPGRSKNTPSSTPTGRVIVLTGPSGAGKTTVARLLTDTIAPSVHLHADDFWHFIRRGAIEPYLPEAHSQNEIVIGVLAAAACGYAGGGYQVVCDGIIGPWFLDLFRTATTKNRIDLHYVVLRPDEITTLARAANRTSHNALTEPEPIRSLHHQFSDLGNLEQHVLDTSNLDAITTVEHVQRAIDRSLYQLN